MLQLVNQYSGEVTSQKSPGKTHRLQTGLLVLPLIHACH